jgi:hypothetical protein
MVRRIYIDIETVPPDENVRAEITVGMVRKLDRRFVAAERGDDELCNDTEFQRLALHAERGRVLCIGVIVERDGCELLRGVYGRDRETRCFHLDEARTLRGFWAMMRDFDPRRDIVIGHNVMEFDAPFLYKRSMVCNVAATVSLSFARYRRQPIYDTLKEWAHWDQRRYISLVELARVLKVEETKTGWMDGSKVYDFYCAGKHEEIAEYCMQDVEVVRAVYRRMTFAAQEPDGAC